MFGSYPGAVDLSVLIANVLPAVFSILILIFVVLGLILAYHWRKYAYNLPATFLFQLFYWAVGAFLVAGMSTAFIAFGT